MEQKTCMVVFLVVFPPLFLATNGKIRWVPFMRDAFRILFSFWDTRTDYLGGETDGAFAFLYRFICLMKLAEALPALPNSKYI
ncbi:hypothetical protein LX36DRAFT_451082 [Colletotrichum falcatum]|nr:hypothetical protein LX36DRAFT_451082 [Colletotrichum falcatum]